MKWSLIFLLVTGTLAGTAQTKGRTLTTLAERELIPEGITVYKNKIFISSINKHLILTADEKGNTKNFIAPNQDGYLEGLGMKIDTVRGLLWALSNIKDSGLHTSQIHAFELTNGKMKYHYKIQDTVPHLFNDLVLDATGKLYITDTYYSAVYTYDAAANTLALFLKSPYLNYPNGLAFGKKNELYIATYENGLVQLDLKTKVVKPLTGYKDSATAHGPDGLLYWSHSLIGVYNNSGDRASQGIIQYDLDEADANIIGEKWIDRGNPAFYEPTTAALSGNVLYLLANSHLAAYNANKTSTKGIESKLLAPAVVMYNLSK